MNTQPRVLKWSLIIGIMIVLNLFFNYALSLAYKQPDYQTYCPQPTPIYAPTEKLPTFADYQQSQQSITCQKNYDTAQKDYDKNVFIALIILGALCVFVGNFFKGNEVISNGLALGGVLSFIIASMRYWGSADNLIKVIILAIALGLLFWVAMKKFKNNV